MAQHDNARHAHAQDECPQTKPAALKAEKQEDFPRGWLLRHNGVGRGDAGGQDRRVFDEIHAVVERLPQCFSWCGACVVHEGLPYIRPTRSFAICQDVAMHSAFDYRLAANNNFCNIGDMTSTPRRDFVIPDPKKLADGDDGFCGVGRQIIPPRDTPMTEAQIKAGLARVEAHRSARPR